MYMSGFSTLEVQEISYTLDNLGDLEGAGGDLNRSTIEFAFDNLTTSDVRICRSIQKGRDKGWSGGESRSWNFGAQYVVRQQSLNCSITRRYHLSSFSRGPFSEGLVRGCENGDVF